MISSEAFVVQLSYCQYVIQRNIEGITHEESLLAPPTGGNCLNWVVGHVVSSRNQWMRALGLDPLWAKAEGGAYDRASEPLTDPDQALPFARLVADLERSQEPLIAAVGGKDAAFLAEPAPFSPAQRPDETWGSLMAGLCFHESYHAGQTGLLRRLVGREGVLT